MNKRQARSSKLAATAFAATLTFVVLPNLAQGGGSPPAAQEAGAPPFDLSDPAKIEAGKRTFNSTCASFCHGQNPTLFVGRTGLSEEHVYNTIRDGGKGATPMPPWGDVFSHDEIWQLVAYLKSIGKW